MSEAPRTLVATFGFDIDFVIRRLSSGNYSGAILLSLRTEEGRSRVEKAFSSVRQYCVALRKECELAWLEPQGLLRSVYSVLSDAASKGEVDLYLTGGPRALVVSALLAALMLDGERIGRVRVVVEGEAFDYSWEASASVLRNMLELDHRSRRLLMTLAAQGRATLAEVSRATGLPRATAFRRLKELADAGLVCSGDGEYFLCPEAQKVL
ncbi:MAG: CRISPR-associated CARF protein Csa3 [Desulfurococcaceae archaeon]